MRLWLRLWAVACLLLSGLACGDDDDRADRADSVSKKDAGEDRDTDEQKDTGVMFIPRGGNAASGAGGSGGQSSAADDGAYLCKPKPGDVGSAAESGADCCAGLGSCQAGLGATSGLPHETCKANPDLRC